MIKITNRKMSRFTNNHIIKPIGKFIFQNYHSAFTIGFSSKSTRAIYYGFMPVIFFIRNLYKNNYRFTPLLKTNPFINLIKPGLPTVDSGNYIIPLDRFNIMRIHVGKYEVKSEEKSQFYLRYNITYHFYGLNNSYWNNKINKHVIELEEICDDKLKKKDKLLMEECNKRRDESFSLDKIDLDNVIYHGKAKFINDVNVFLKSKDIYLKYGIPYKLGILLYGPPGTGKTTMIKALASYINRTIYICDMFSISGISEWNRLYCIEEIDLELQNKDNVDKYAVDNDKLKKVITAIDNMGSGSILCITTNHIERLPEQILRDGRIDIKLKFTNFNKDEVCEMVEKFELDKNDILSQFNNSDDINPAYLQNYLREIKLNQIYDK